MRRLYKIILILFISTILTIFIYYNTLNKEINLLSLGDGVASGMTPSNLNGTSYNDILSKNVKNYNLDFAKPNYRVIDLLNDIKNNTKINNNYIEQLIHSSNIITISIGMDELSNIDNLNTTYINTFLNNYDNLLYILRKLNNKEIILLSLYKYKYIKDSYIILINSKLKEYSQKYNIKFIDINLILSTTHFPKENSYYFNYNAHLLISNKIKSCYNFNR